MSISNTEINGFLIDTFNQYGLPEGKREGTCPLCSSSRKPENRKKKCASYDWGRGLGTCHNCNSTFQLHTYQRKSNANKIYVKPEVPKVFLGSKIINWFNSRGISQETLRA